MLKLHWDANRAAHAKAYSLKCKFSHNPNLRLSGYGAIGENLYLRNRLPKDYTRSLLLAATSWFNEHANYNYETKRCSGGMCGHYAQMVWARTYAVGCAVADCANVLDDWDGHVFNKAQIVTCNYAGAGNYHGASPYIKGPTASQCPP